MSIFRFKRFEVVNERSSMKVNTDGVLLGAAVTILPTDRHILDVGTGTGTIALMLAQRLLELKLTEDIKDFQITGIDIDRASTEEAALNFAHSPWSGHLQAIHTPLQTLGTDALWDLIVSNPPYYDSSLQNPDSRKNMARHIAGRDEDNLPDSPLSFRTLAEFAKRHPDKGGRLAMILPADQEREVTRYAAACGLHLSRILRIRTTPDKPYKRMIVEFITEPVTVCEQSLTLQDKEGKRTQEYISLTEDFYL